MLRERRSFSVFVALRLHYPTGLSPFQRLSANSFRRTLLKIPFLLEHQCLFLLIYPNSPLLISTLIIFSHSFQGEGVNPAPIDSGLSQSDLVPTPIQRVSITGNIRDTVTPF